MVNGKIFLDRDGKTFLTLINFLRNNCEIYPNFETAYEEKLFKAELQYWDINPTKDDLPLESTSEVVETSPVS
jgi:hypothetical protein